jgi:hypothetical protein
MIFDYIQIIFDYSSVLRTYIDCWKLGSTKAGETKFGCIFQKLGCIFQKLGYSILKVSIINPKF